ncbi:hypothetical protein ACGFX4_09085 [Kitasatospora sp. NPDC048365]|uniref:hypothetical protein n=1 Tax=Kitasatospora sp. NPDC048365 TaxID=3364050 RepID=UPI003721EB8F
MRATFEVSVRPGLTIVVEPDDPGPPDLTGDLWVGLVANEDPAWPLSLDVLAGDDCGLGPHPDLRIASQLAGCHDVDVLCGVDPAFVDVDPQDPYYRLALVGGQWHLASTAGTRLELCAPAPAVGAGAGIRGQYNQG